VYLHLVINQEGWIIRSSCLTVFVILLPLVLGAQLFAGISQKQVDAAAAVQTRPQSPQTDSKHPSTTKAIKHVSKKYGFTFSLPATWKGCSAFEGTWDSAAGDPHQGPSVTLINPQSTSEKGYQDIYIMVFSHAQWESLQGGDFAVSAAPVGPGELGRSRK
jgi:hypothetical protein